MRFTHKQKQPDLTRRSPTMAGRTATVFSYHASRSAVVTNTGRKEPIKLRRKRVWLQRLPSTLSAVVVLGTLVYATVLSTNPKVAIDDQQGVSFARKPEVYQQYGAQLLGSSLANKSKLTIDTESIASQMRAHFPELDDVVVTVPLLGHRPGIVVTTNHPVFIVQGGVKDYFLGADGRILVPVSDASTPTEGLTRIVDQSGLSATVGQQLLPRDSVEFIQELIHQFDAKHIKITSIVLPPAVNEVRITPADASYYVRFNTAADARQQAGTYFALRHKFEQDGGGAKEYIDVRVDERAFYK